MIKDLLTKFYESYNAQCKLGGSGSGNGSTNGRENLAIEVEIVRIFWILVMMMML